MLPTRTGSGFGAALGSDPEPCEAENQHKIVQRKSGRKGKRPNCEKRTTNVTTNETLADDLGSWAKTLATSMSKSCR